MEHEPAITPIAPTHECSSYPPFHEERLECILKSVDEVSNQAFLIDLLDFLQQCTNQCNIIKVDKIVKVLRLMESVKSDRFISSFHRILRQDLRLRPAFISTELTDELKRYLNLCLQHMRGNGSQSLLALQLALGYLTEVLMCWISHNSTAASTTSIQLSQQLSFATKWPFFGKVIDLVFSIAKSLEPVVPEHPEHLLLYHNLLADLNKLLCLPFAVDSTIVQSVAVTFEVKLSDPTYSNTVRRCVINNVQSVLLKRYIIDIHLDKEFKLQAPVSEALQNEPFNLSKFCCIHLCRLPLNREGNAQYDLSYFVFLLYTLIESHLLLITGIQPVSCVTPTKKMKDIPKGFKYMVESMRPHIVGLVDRISENEVLLLELSESGCWNDIQNLSRIIDVVQALDK